MGLDRLGPSGVHHQSTSRRDALRSPCRFFSASRRSFDPRVGLVGRRGFGRRASATSRSRSRARAAPRFCAWLRRSVAVTAVPVARCTSRTALSVLLRCWPPGPLPVKKVSSHSASSAASGSASARRAAAPRADGSPSRASPSAAINSADGSSGTIYFFNFLFYFFNFYYILPLLLFFFLRRHPAGLAGPVPARPGDRRPRPDRSLRLLRLRAGTQLYARPAPHQHLRARYRFVSYDYVADPAFDEIDDPNHLTPRDRTEHQVDASWRYREDAWAFGAGLDYTRRHYTTLQSRNARTGGTPDPLTGERNPDQELSIVEPSAELDLTRLEGRLDLSFRYGVQLQNDPYQGYYSSTTHHPRVQVKLAATPRLALQAALEGWYEIYGADGSTRLDAGDTTRVDLRTKLGGEVAYRLGGGLSARAEASWLKRSTNYRDYVPPPAGTSAYDIRFDYTNLTVLGGLEYKL